MWWCRVRPRADWDTTRAWCRAFAEAMAAEQPGQIRLRGCRRSSGAGASWWTGCATALGLDRRRFLSPRARPGATVATPLAWREVTETLDPAAFTIATVPQRLGEAEARPLDGL